MDKETLSKYGWVVIVIIVLVILMSFAAPFGQYFYDSTMKMVETLKNSTNIEQLFEPNGGAAEIVTNYTSAQIEADEHLYAIGKTQPEYVVAEFNDDYTEVIITKNGDKSDGLMADYDIYQYNFGERIESLDGNFSPMEYQYKTLKNVVIADGIKSIGIGAFCGCINIDSIDMADSIELIDLAAFVYCASMKDFKLPANITAIKSYSFANCGNGDIVIPDGVTVIENYAFQQSDITSITIPRSVTSIIGDAGLGTETKLKTIYGYSDSYAKTWFDGRAGIHGAVFVPLDETPDEPENTNTYEAAEQWIDETGMDDVVKSLSETYNTSYYASLLLALAAEDDAVFAEALPLAQQSDAAIEEYFNTNMGFDINDYFKENIGATAHQIAYYIENGNWPA